MKMDASLDLSPQLGADRVLSPAGSLPQQAERLDPSGPVRPNEIEVAVERLCLDSTSFREIREHSGGDPSAMADRITEIVRERGKMHNPETDSGGVLLGTVTRVGEQRQNPPEAGRRVVTLASLTLTPLRLDGVTRLDPGDPQVEVAGTAYICGRSGWAPVPDDLPLEVALEVYDVCAAGWQTRELAPPGGTVCVLGAGNAGKLVLAAARDSMGGGMVAAVDIDADAVQRVQELGLCDVGVSADLRQPLSAVEALRAAGVPAADLTVVVVNATGCEPTAILATADGGSVLFFSMATSFSAAALANDGLARDVRMLVGSGYSPDGGAYAIDLARRSGPLRRALGLEEAA